METVGRDKRVIRYRDWLRAVCYRGEPLAYSSCRRRRRTGGCMRDIIFRNRWFDTRLGIELSDKHYPTCGSCQVRELAVRASDGLWGVVPHAVVQTDSGACRVAYHGPVYGSYLRRTVRRSGIGFCATCNILIIASAYFLPEVHSIEKVLFGLCYTFMSSTAVDWVMTRVRQSVQFFIFSSYHNEIARAIMTQIPRGVTILDGHGGYTGKDMKVVTVIARKNESTRIFRLVRAIDPNAFVSETQTIGVFGQGFDSIKEK